MAKIKNPLTIVKDGGTPAVLVEKTITQNGDYSGTTETPPVAGFSKVTVNVLPTLFRSVVDGSIRSVAADDFGDITQIKKSAFGNCANLTLIELPNTITTIGDFAFEFTAIKKITFPESVTSIGNRALYHATSLKEIIVKGTATVLSSCCLYGGSLSTLQKIIFLSSTVLTMQSSDALNSTNNCPIYVPYASIASYKSATNWATHASRIFPLVATIADLANIDTTTYTKACVVGADESYKQYTYDGSQWNEVV